MSTDESFQPSLGKEAVVVELTLACARCPDTPFGGDSVKNFAFFCDISIGGF